MRSTLLAAAAAAIHLGMASAALAQAPTWSSEQTGVWEVVTQSWKDEVARNGKWPNAYATDQMVAWDADWPMPRYKDSIAKWSRFNDSQRQTLQYEIAPVAIAVNGGTAVVNYTAVTISQRAEDKPEREAVGIVETLVRSGGGWKFLASTSFNLKK